MSDLGSPPRIARVLSATLQAVVAAEIESDPADAFMTEFRDLFIAAETDGILGVRRVYHELFVDVSCALYSLAQYVASKTDEDPRVVLGQLIRTYRKAVEHG